VALDITVVRELRFPWNPPAEIEIASPTGHFMAFSGLRYAGATLARVGNEMDGSR
jgi:hypothetical protein